MAKELFDSPRYGKKGKVCKDSFSVTFVFICYCLLVPLLSVLITKFFDVIQSVEISLTVFLLMEISFLLLFIVSGGFKYKQYVNRLKENKDLFRSTGKKQFVVPKKLFMTNDLDLNVSLTLCMLAIQLKANKNPTASETERVKNYINQNDKANYEKRIKEFNKYLKEDYSVEDVAFAVYWWFEVPKEQYYDPGHKYYLRGDERFDTINAMLDVAYADGDFTEEEEYFIRYSAYHMRIYEHEYERTIRKFASDKRLKDGFEQYLKARYGKYGGYWSEERDGKKTWHSFDYEDKEKNNSKSSGNRNATVSAELQKAYSVLGISVDATPSEINASKRNLLRMNHPDMVANKGQEAIDAATIRCQTINQAYEVLKANGKC